MMGNDIKSTRVRRPFYSDYVRHALRFYSRNLQMSRFKTNADRDNWMACDDAIKGYSDRDSKILLVVYSGFDTLSDNVYNAAKEFNVNQNIIWDMMKDFERKVAQARNLI